MAGIYIHIPYCRQACSYCDFYFSTSLGSKDALLGALATEAQLRSAGYVNQTVSTIYFGGGTPSLLSPAELNAIIQAVRAHYTVSENAEITLEANPDNLTAGYLQQLHAIGINRLSIGLQSFGENELKELNRTHSPQQNLEVVKRAQDAGFDNITVDLIYGTPWTDEQQWTGYVQKVIDLNIQHISCYQLTIEEKTQLSHRLKTGAMPALDDERTEKQFLILIDKLKQSGFIHYEVSNFGKPGFFSQHNSNYWKDVPYVGLGPSAHGYTGDTRYANVPNIHTYIKQINAGAEWYAVEDLSPKDQYNDMVLTGLRTIFGVDITLMAKKLNQSFVNHFQRKAQSYIEQGQIQVSGYVYTLKEEAFLFADRISADLFMV